MTVSASEGWEGYIRLKLENSSTNWSNTSSNANGSVVSSFYPRNPYLTSAPFDTDVAMERIYVIGSRTPADTTEGVIEISGSIERPYFENASDNEIVWHPAQDEGVNGSNYNLAEVCGLYGDNVSECAILIKPNANQTIVLHAVKFHSYSFGLAQGEVTSEHCDFTANNISTK